MCQRCCLLTISGAHPGRESPDLFPLELSQILHGMTKGWEKDDPSHWEHTPKISPKREKGGGGGNPELDLTLDTAMSMGAEERLEVRGANGSH